MIGYKNEVFCSFYLNCKKGKECEYALLPGIKHGADTAHMPIAEWVNPPGCFQQTNQRENEKLLNKNLEINS